MFNVCKLDLRLKMMKQSLCREYWLYSSAIGPYPEVIEFAAILTVTDFGRAVEKIAFSEISLTEVPAVRSA